MEIEILGAHNLESTDTRLVTLLIDGVLAVDAGSLTSGLTLEAQANIEAILLSHRHFDHIKDVAIFGLATAVFGPTPVYATADVLEALSTHITNGILFPDFTKAPSAESPSLEFRTLEPLKTVDILGYKVTPRPCNHSVPSHGFEIEKDGKTLFYTSDTGPGLGPLWETISPQLLITELTGPNRLREWLNKSGHLTPAQLLDEMKEFERLKGFLPEVILVHFNPYWRDEVETELEAVAAELDTPVTGAWEGMKIEL
ncbi:MAG: MBL fold metallo-hydrolase [Dehalococcoidia bacterium]